MKKLYAFILLCCAGIAAHGQGVLLIDPNGDGGFEHGSTLEANGWTYVGDPSVNVWQVGTAAVGGGSKGCFIGHSPTDNTGSNEAATTNHIYRDITIPEGAVNVKLSFKFRQTLGEIYWDKFCVSTFPSYYTPVSGGPFSTVYPNGGAPVGAIQKLWENTDPALFADFTLINPATEAGSYNMSGAHLDLSDYAGMTFRLCFTFSNADGILDVSNPAIDDISLSYEGVVTPVTGVLSVCQGGITHMSNATPGGTWSSSNTAVGTIDAYGDVTAIGAGTTTTTYTFPGGGTTSTATVTVNALPGALSGTTTLCAGSSVILTSATADLEWSSSNTDVANVSTASSTTGLVAGVSAGTAVISYATASGCARTIAVTVNDALAAVTGESVICLGGAVTMANASGGGTWSSSNTARAAIGVLTGIVSAVSAGTTTISYIAGPACFVTKTLTVTGSPETISGPSAVCIGSSISLYHASEGGSWSSSNALAATVDMLTGSVTGQGAGTVTITYHISAGCFSTKVITVNALPAAISGTASVCEGASVTLTNSGAGTWSSENAEIATVPATPGSVTGVSAGTVNISFRLTSTGCYTTKVVTVTALPSVIEGSSNICISATEAYTSLPEGGTWATSSASIASIGLSTGTATGNAAGSATLTYTAGGCRRTKAVTVSAVPGSITGTLSLCSGGTTSLASATASQTWSSSNPEVATVATATATTGLVTGTGAGTATISYTNAAGCSRTTVVTVSAALTAISGSSSICIGGAVAFSNTTPGGTWSSSSSVATVNSSGFVTGVSAGTATITYRTNATCFTTRTVTVGTAPSAAITGPTGVCIGATVALSHVVADGTWSSSTPAKATISAAGVVTGVAAGTTTITYYTAESCYRTYTVTVNGAPNAVGGTPVMCEGATATVTNTSPGGSWVSADPAIASVGSASGIITGNAAGTVLISYRLTSTGCASTKVATINAMPSVITGNNPVCVGSAEAFSATPAGGTWVSGTTSVASVGMSSGMVTGVAAGTSNISYTLSNGCRRTRVATVNSQPGAITGTLSMCAGGSTQLVSSTAGLTWSSSNETVATVTAASAIAGQVSGLTEGTATISYTNSSSCSRTVVVTVTAGPAAIVGDDAVCVGGTTTFTNPTAGGTWASSSAAVTIGVSTGLVTGVNAGTSTITYRAGATCFATKVVSVTAQPSTAITGPTSVCVGANITLSHPVTTGTWASSNAVRATVSPAGVVTGITAGTGTISYFVGAGCYRTYNITVMAPSMPVSGNGTVCEGLTTTVSCATAGGTWSSTDPSKASITVGSGVITGVAAGTAFVVYTLTGSGCAATKMVTVNPLPTAITSGGPICVGTTDVFASSPAGGTWTTGAGIIATADAATGTVTGVAAGTANITYTISTGCIRVKAATVNALPAVITGPTSVNELSSVTLSSATGGGTWTSGDPTKATIGSTTGIATGVATGTTLITYQLTATGCQRTRVLTVNPFGTRAAAPANDAAGAALIARIFPSPTTGMLTVEAPIGGTFTIFTYDGRKIDQYEITAASTNITLPATLAAGVYMCRFEGVDGSVQAARIVLAP